MAGFLVVNPRAGDAGPSAEELAAAARSRRVTTHALQQGEDAAEIARNADADVLGVAGGDGSLAPVAQVAIERGLPFVCVPYGTRNHFARDLGLDRRDPVAAIDAFAGREVRIDVGWAGERLFLNNVSLGLYAELVRRRAHHRRRREALARIRALLLPLVNRQTLGITIDGEPIDSRIVLIANNAYVFKAPVTIGARDRLDEGLLHLYVVVRARADERAATQFVLNSAEERIDAAVDGESTLLATPTEFRIEPRALRVLVPERVA